MHTMMRRCVQNKFEKFWKLMNGFRMYPELIDQTDLLHE